MPTNYVRTFGRALARRDGGWRCHYCGQLLRATDTPYGNSLANSLPLATVDHVRPVSVGGARYDLDNMVLACEYCNTGKGSVLTMAPKKARKPQVKLPAAGSLARLFRGKRNRARKLKRKAR